MNAPGIRACHCSDFRIQRVSEPYWRRKQLKLTHCSLERLVLCAIYGVLGYAPWLLLRVLELWERSLTLLAPLRVPWRYGVWTIVCNHIEHQTPYLMSGWTNQPGTARTARSHRRTFAIMRRSNVTGTISGVLEGIAIYILVDAGGQYNQSIMRSHHWFWKHTSSLGKEEWSSCSTQYVDGFDHLSFVLWRKLSFVKHFGMMGLLCSCPIAHNSICSTNNSSSAVGARIVARAILEIPCLERSRMSLRSLFISILLALMNDESKSINSRLDIVQGRYKWISSG